jgi:hypothetical protein
LRLFREVVMLPRSRLRLGLQLAGLLLVLAALDGCTRGFYRQRADKEVNDLLAEKDKYAAWKIEQYHVYPDPRARFADPQGNYDRPAMPPDDEAAFRMSPHPQRPGRAGVGRIEGTGYLEMIRAWDNQNRDERAAQAANGEANAPATGVTPASYRFDPLQDLYDKAVNAPAFLLDFDQTVELGVINSREFQNFREDLYLAALPVTLTRFSFAFQGAVAEEAFRRWAGPLSSVGYQNRWSLNTTASASKFFSTGALLTTAFANTTVFNFARPNNAFTSVSAINLDFVQPLLRGGGRAVALEPLTQSERNLFYSVRAFARFREEFYSAILLGTSLRGSLSAQAGTGGGASGSVISNLAALGIASTDVAGEFRGYLPTLFRQFDMAVDRKYVADLEQALKLFEGFQEGGQVAPLQVDQVRSTLLTARNAVLKDMQDTTNAMDQFKLQLGVPANLPLVLDDAPGRPITKQLDRYYEVLTQADLAFKLVANLDDIAALEQGHGLSPEQLRARLLQIYTRHPLVQGTPFQQKITPRWKAWQDRNDKGIEDEVKRLTGVRTKLLDEKTDLELQGQALPPAKLRELAETDFDLDLSDLEKMLRIYQAEPWVKNPKISRTKVYRQVVYTAQVVLVAARNDRLAQVGQWWPELPTVPVDDVDLLGADVDQAQEYAVKVALSNRWDLMNARAQVVDAWRQLAVTANALLGVANVQYHLDATTPPGGNRPLAFSAAATNQELIINAQLPLVRVAERNNYRAALIDYERARRSLMALEDGVAAAVRFDVRQLHLFAANFKIQQKVLESLYSQVENSLEVIVAPADPDALKASGTTGQANAAALTQQYLGALGSLNNAQTRMYDIWLSYLATRMQLFLDLERLPLDNRGVWTDELGIPQSNRAAGPRQLPPQDQRGPGEPAPQPRPFGGPAGGAVLGRPVAE